MKKQLTAVCLIFAILLTVTGCAAAYAAEKPPLPETEPVGTLPAPTEAPRALTKEQAVQIALEHLGFSPDQVTRLRAEYEVDDRIPQFDVEFLQDEWEYEFEIHAETGKILSFDKDHKYD